MSCASEDVEELEELRADYAAVRAAIRAILGGAQSYSLNTSQTQQQVTRASLGSLSVLRDKLRNDIRMLEAQCSKDGAVRVVPSW